VSHAVIDWQAWCAGRPSTLEELGSGSGMARQAADAGIGDLDVRAIIDATSMGGPPGSRHLESRHRREAVQCATHFAELV
jgi:predicted NBD/HSP70 family sugar kinase